MSHQGSLLDMNTHDDTDAADGVAEFRVTCDELKKFMEARGSEAGKALEEKFGDVNGLVRALHSSAVEGLLGLEKDLENRKRLFGVNFIPPKPPKSFWRLVWEALDDTILRILLVAALLSLILGMVIEDVKTGWIEGFAIIIAVVIVSLVTAVNDYQKEQQFRNLQNKIESEQTIETIRHNHGIDLETADLVVGDVVMVKYGDLIPADGVVLQCNDLKVDESSLTGESDMVKKGDRDPFLLSGTHIMEGSGKMIVTAVGLNSQSGIIFALLGATESQETNKKAEGNDQNKHQPPSGDGFEDVDLNDAGNAGEDEGGKEREKSVLQGKLTKLAVTIGWLGVGAAVITTVVIIIRYCVEIYVQQGQSWNNSHLMGFLRAFITGLTIMVVAIPEGLPLAVTIALAYSVKRMLDDNNLVRHLDACETMGNATAICSDKTGTLTTNRMTVVQSYLMGTLHKTKPPSEAITDTYRELLCRGIALNCSYSSRIEPPEPPATLPIQVGNKTECALLGFVLELGDTYQVYRDETPEEKFTKVYTFNSVRKSMTTAVPLSSGGHRIYSKGASEIMLSKCSYTIGENGEMKKFAKADQQNLIKNVIEPMASDGLRTICLAYRDFPEGEPDWENENAVVSNLVCLAVVGIEDPVRNEVPAAILKCQSAGITVRMVTGDNINTARSIATKCGILNPNDGFLVLDGKEFNKRIRDKRGVVKQDLLDQVWPDLRVLARSSPQDKYTLVKGIIESKLTKSREVVAVTGDGTNDGPALKKADVGFAMGIQGTDVAKEASDIVLTDDNFTSIVNAVKWGRNVYDSISKFIQFQLTVNLVAILTAIIGAVVEKQSPLTATQLLWVNLIMDSFASLALATEQPSDNLLDRKPYGRTKPLISRSMLRFIIGHSIYQLIVLLILAFYGHKLFDIEYGFTLSHKAPPTQHHTMVFNTFVLMQIFNEINSRKVHGERNVFNGIFKNRLFLIIVIGTLLVQVLLVEFTDRVFMVAPLDAEQWMWCIFLGFTELLWGQVVLSIPKFAVPKKWRMGSKSIPVQQVLKDGGDGTIGKLLWIRGLTRLQYQIRVVNAFRSTLDHRNRTMNIISPAVFNSLVAPVSGGIVVDDSPTTPTETIEVNSPEHLDGKATAQNNFDKI